VLSCAALPPPQVLADCAAGDTALLLRDRAAVSSLLHVYGHMMLRDGLFHADPHPGNFLLRASSPPAAAAEALGWRCCWGAGRGRAPHAALLQLGRRLPTPGANTSTPATEPLPRSAQEDGGIALLDFGQCKALSGPQHVNLCRLYEGLATGEQLQMGRAQVAQRAAR
jgi:predicted unusual protein kinase regulating ubiquinone biosynthesis (AarF/ABC1/UbiB family)